MLGEKPVPNEMKRSGMEIREAPARSLFEIMTVLGEKFILRKPLGEVEGSLNQITKISSFYRRKNQIW
ncbi:MAG: hypothetical protein ACQEWD_11050 [Bacteroidota bacterium]